MTARKKTSLFPIKSEEEDGEKERRNHKENWVKEHIPLLIFSLSSSFLHSLIEGKEERMIKRKRERETENRLERERKKRGKKRIEEPIIKTSCHHFFLPSDSRIMTIEERPRYSSSHFLSSLLFHLHFFGMMTE